MPFLLSRTTPPFGFLSLPSGPAVAVEWHLRQVFSRIGQTCFWKSIAAPALSWAAAVAVRPSRRPPARRRSLRSRKSMRGSLQGVEEGSGEDRGDRRSLVGDLERPP